MSDEGTESPPPKKHVSYARVAALLIPAAAVLVGAAVVLSRTEDPALTSKNRRIDEFVLTTFGVKPAVQNRLDKRYTDADDDLLADAPEDESAWIDPETIQFTYIASKEPERDQETWAAVVEHLTERAGREVNYRHFEKFDDQLAAIAKGELHVCGLNTGAVPKAVNAYGFIPVCTYGAADGSFGYRMQIVVPAGSHIKSLADIQKDDLFAFTRPSSNSGFKAPLMLLMHDYGKQPERDYQWAFAGGHDDALRGITEEVYDAAAVASDMFQRASAAGLVKEKQFRVIYESERFPPAAIGYIYNLKPELAGKIREALLDFSFEGTQLVEEFGPAGGERFVPVTYKDDWALIRRTDDDMGVVHVVQAD